MDCDKMDYGKTDYGIDDLKVVLVYLSYLSTITATIISVW